MTARRPTSSKRTAIVPRVVFRAVAAGAGVIPLCVTASLASPGCGGFTGVASDAFVPDAAADALRDSLSDTTVDAPSDIFAPGDVHEGGGG
jgi:hypothetical protein